jgi:ferredoxin-type protein NapH
MLRRILQIFGTILPNSYLPVIWKKVIYQGQLKGICAPLFNCYACPLAVVHCPIGAIQHFMAVSKIPYYIIGYLSLIGLAVGRMACGWICPFGFFQDLMAKIKIRKRKFRFPSYLGYLRYVSLALLVIILPLITHEHWFSKLCPWGAIEAGIPWGLWNPNDPNFLALTPANSLIRDIIGGAYYLKIAILAGFLGLMLFFKRPFCFLACPLGAIFSLFNKISIIRLGVDTEACDKCNKCLRNCPAGLKVYEDPNNLSCIRCLECTKCDKVKLYSIFGKKPMTRVDQ